MKKWMIVVLLLFFVISTAACSVKEQTQSEISTQFENTENFSSNTENSDNSSFENVTEEKNPSYNEIYDETNDGYWENIDDTPASDFEYYLRGRNEFESRKEYISTEKAVEITRYLGNDSTVKIPEQIDGYPVVCVNDFLLVRNPLDVKVDFAPVKELYIPESVVYNIPYFRFGMLERIRLPLGRSDNQNNTTYTFIAEHLKTIHFPISKRVILSNVYLNELEEMYFESGTESICINEGSIKELNKLRLLAVPKSVKKNYQAYLREDEQGNVAFTEEEYNPFYNSSNLIILCEEGSYAEKYAERYGFQTKIVSE